MIKHLRITVSVLLAVAASASPLSAWALGLGQINVLSQRDQPLLAEIPVISNDPSELEALHAQLASPETFARVGLAAPQGVVSDLQFAVALSASGRPVIRVTSAVPVQQPLLTFLLQVDWGQGRLVREYSALLDTPQTAAAPVQPPIEAPTVDATAISDTGGAIVRPPEPLPPEPTAPTPSRTDGQVASVPPTPEPPAPVVPTPEPVPAAAEPVEAAPVVAAAPLQVPADDTRVVRPGETLGGIAAELGRGFNLDQTIVALLRANPEAFIGGNANRLKSGAVLRLPDDASIARYTPEEAALVVREQVAQWRGSGRALPQPPAVVGAPAGTPATAPAAGGRAGRELAQARLEIAPPSANDSKQAGTRSGVSAGGEGDMLRQQEIQQTNETLAAREAEVQELKARVAELEQLQQKQNELIALKDSELAASQQRLANTQGTGATTGSLGPWLGAGGGLLVIALAAWWWLRRRPKPVPAAPERRRDTERLAAAIPKIAASAGGDDTAQPTQAAAEPAAAPASTPAPVAAPDPDPAAAPLPAEPGWSRLAKPAEAEAPKPKPTLAKPTWHAGEVGTPPPQNAAPPGQGRLDLAKAYLEMGDRETARSLLQEVATRGDTIPVRREAERLLQELG